jgi:pimeloyl-ACP methyl ester carboxylesterase
MKQATVGRWKRAAAKQRFHALEQAIWDDQGYPPPEPLDIPTWAGTTRVYRWRNEGDPVVLLHGMGGTGLTWGPYVEGLAGQDVYAIDTIGDVGRSEQTALIADAGDLSRWLDETLAGVGVEHAHLAGTSYGGYLALNLAARSPQRVASITLIDAGGLAPFRLGRFMLWGLPSLLGSKAPGPIRRAMARTRPLLEDPRLMKLALLGQTNHPFGLPQPIELSDDELRSITVPTTAVIAGRSAPFEPRLAAQRAALIPGAVVDVIDGAGHEVMWTHVDRCVAHVFRHCRGNSDRA